MIKDSKTIVLAGGGTGGPTVPLLAVADYLRKKHPNLKFVFIGTNKGPESKLAREANIEFLSIPAAKWRRYFSLQNFIDLFILPAAFLKSLFIIIKFKADVVVGAGGYVAVPVVWAAKFLGRKVLIHQQDLVPSLSNTLTKKFADVITITFPEQHKYFPGAMLTGNPIRLSLSAADKAESKRHFGFTPQKPVVLIYGGASGSLFINRLVEQTAPQLTDAGVQILHQTGKNVDIQTANNEVSGYVRHEFFTQEVRQAYAAADLVVSRAGMANISELSHLSKPSIIIPMPNSHQEKNAEYLHEKNAAVILKQEDLDEGKLVREIKSLIGDTQKQKIIAENIYKIMPHDATEKISMLVYNLT